MKIPPKIQTLLNNTDRRKYKSVSQSISQWPARIMFWQAHVNLQNHFLKTSQVVWGVESLYHSFRALSHTHTIPPLLWNLAQNTCTRLLLPRVAVATESGVSAALWDELHAILHWAIDSPCSPPLFCFPPICSNHAALLLFVLPWVYEYGTHWWDAR